MWKRRRSVCGTPEGLRRGAICAERARPDTRCVVGSVCLVCQRTRIVHQGRARPSAMPRLSALQQAGVVSEDAVQKLGVKGIHSAEDLLFFTCSNYQDVVSRTGISADELECIVKCVTRELGSLPQCARSCSISSLRGGRACRCTHSMPQRTSAHSDGFACLAVRCLMIGKQTVSSLSQEASSSMGY